MTYEQRMALHKAVTIIRSLNPVTEDSQAVSYLENLDLALHDFFKQRLNDWQFDLFRNRYCD
jgi:hypothetical protein